MLTLKFFGLVFIFVALMNVILALVNDENGMFTDDYNPYEDCPIKAERHGKWEDESDTSFSHCSLCDYVDIGHSLYCPKCGARMDGDDNA